MMHIGTKKGEEKIPNIAWFSRRNGSPVVGSRAGSDFSSSRRKGKDLDGPRGTKKKEDKKTVTGSKQRVFIFFPQSDFRRPYHRLDQTLAPSSIC
jgi:hypothetical protein